MPKNDKITELLTRYPLISDQVDTKELSVMLRELRVREKHLGADTSVVEFGCYRGTTSLFIRRLLNSLGSKASFHVYDSFAGLPEKTFKDLSPAGEQFKTGELSASKKDFEMQFKKAGLKLPRIHKGWFNELEVNDIPDNISFAYIDGDYYDSIKDSLYLIEKKLLTGALIVVDDYTNEALPGAARAVDEWIQGHICTMRIESSLAIISYNSKN